MPTGGAIMKRSVLVLPGDQKSCWCACLTHYLYDGGTGVGVWVSWEHKRALMGTAGRWMNDLIEELLSEALIY